MEKHRFSGRDFIRESVLAGAVAPLIGRDFITAKREKTKKSVLMVWGGWDGHEPKKMPGYFCSVAGKTRF